MLRYSDTWSWASASYIIDVVDMNMLLLIQATTDLINGGDYSLSIIINGIA